MKQTKLVVLLKTFTEKEWERFLDFVQSPYHNKNKALVKLSTFLKSKTPAFECSRKEAFLSVYPQRPFDYNLLGVWMNSLLKLANEFIAIERIKKNKYQMDLACLEEYVDRKLDKHFNFYKRQIAFKFEGQKIGPNKLLYKYLLNHIELLFFTEQKVRKYDLSIQQVYYALNEYYYLQLLKNVCLLFNWSGVVSGQFEITNKSKRLINDLIEEYDDHTPLLKIYLSVFQMLSEGNDQNGQHFESLMLLLEEFHHSIDEGILIELYLLAINFCTRKIRKGENEYIPITLKMYYEGIKRGTLIENGYLSHWTYTNVVRLGLKEKRYEWVENFINEYKHLLPPDAFADAYHMNLADLYFNQLNYDGALEHLTQLQFSDPSYHLTSRLLLIKIFYERGDVEALLSSLTSFTIYLKRNKGSSAVYKRTCLNFCTILQQLLKNKPKKRAELLEQIKTVQPLAERPWLLKVWEEQKL